jgi:sulfatase maturation enzyme AslB (radical SAM superfamily)
MRKSTTNSKTMLKSTTKAMEKLQKIAYDKVVSRRGKVLKTGMPKINFKRMARGNSKLHQIFIFDTLAGTNGTCGFDCPGCYAKKAQVQYFNTDLYRELNTMLATKHLNLLALLIRKQLTSSRNIRTVRIHSSGDFHTQDYIDMWGNIIKEFKDFKFYAYTKKLDKFDFSGLLSQDNFNLLDSFAEIEGRTVLNYGNKDHIEKLVSNGYFLCPATSGNDANFKCNLQCKYCITQNKVCFNQH